MPETIVALPPGMVTTIFDWQPVPQFGFPFWIVICIILVILFVATVWYWWSCSSKLNSVHGWLESLRKMSQFDVQVWVISRVQKLTIECMGIKDNVVANHDTSQIGMWHVNSSMGIVRVGGLPAAVISEDYDQNRDFITEIAICHGCDYANEHMDEMSIKLDEKYKKMVADGILDKKAENPANLCVPIQDADDYDRTGRELLKNLNPDGITIHPYNIFDPNRFRKYFPRGCSAMFFGGELIRDADKLNANVKQLNWIEKNIPLFIAIIFALIIIVAAAYAPITPVV